MREEELTARWLSCDPIRPTIDGLASSSCSYIPCDPNHRAEVLAHVKAISFGWRLGFIAETGAVSQARLSPSCRLAEPAMERVAAATYLILVPAYRFLAFAILVTPASP